MVVLKMMDSNSTLKPFFAEKRRQWRDKLLFLWLSYQRPIRGLLVALGLLASVAFGYVYVSAGKIYDYQDTVDGVHLPEVDAIVVLAGGRGRIAAAGDVWYRYWELSQNPIRDVPPNPAPAQPPVLYLAGVGPKTNWGVVTRSVRRGVVEVLRPQYVVLENESSNTEENALWLARYARQRGWERVLLMTSPYHMKRARYMFEAILGHLEDPLEIETLSVYQEPFEPTEWRSGLHGIRVTIIEYLKWLYYKNFWTPEKTPLKPN